MKGGLTEGRDPARSDWAEDADFWGIPLELLDRTPEHEEDGLWPEHIPAMTAFLEICDLWRISPLPGVKAPYLGLDIAQAEAALRLSGVDVTPDLWAQIRLIEQGAKPALNGD